MDKFSAILTHDNNNNNNNNNNNDRDNILKFRVL